MDAHADGGGGHQECDSEQRRRASGNSFIDSGNAGPGVRVFPWLGAGTLRHEIPPDRRLGPSLTAN